MKQVLLPDNCPESYTVDGDLFHHLIRVLRYTEGRKIEGLDSAGNKYSVIIESVTHSDCTLNVKKTGGQNCKSPELVLYQAVPKGKKLDTIIRCVTEIGVSSVYPLKTEFTIPDMPDRKKMDRLGKICEEAMQQSGSNVFTKIHAPISAEDIPPVGNNECGIVFHHEETENNSLHSVINPDAEKILFLIGPEGGFSKNEIATLEKKGYISVLLGNNIFKVDTAAIAVAGILKNMILEKDFWQKC